jgi:hypothetical protein
MERFRAIAGERLMVLGELLDQRARRLRAGAGLECRSNLRSWAFAGRAVEAPGVVPTDRRGSAQTNPSNELEGEGHIAQRIVRDPSALQRGAAVRASAVLTAVSLGSPGLSSRLPATTHPSIARTSRARRRATRLQARRPRLRGGLISN